MNNNQGWKLFQKLLGSETPLPSEHESQLLNDQPGKPKPESDLVYLRQEYQRKHATARQDLENTQAEKLQVQREIQALQERLAQLGRDSTQIQRDLDDLNETFHQQEAYLLESSLANSYQTFKGAAEFLAQLLGLRTERQKMVEQDPELEDVLADFLALENQLTEVVSNLPKFYRKPLEDQHRQLDQRVRPYLELKQKEEALRYLPEVRLLVIVAPQLDSRKISWIMPIPAELVIAPPDQSDPLYHVGNGLLDAVVGLCMADQWHFDDFQLATWFGFTALIATAEYDGDENQTTITEAALNKHLTTSPLLANLSISITVEQIDPVTWQIGLDGSRIVDTEQITDKEDLGTLSPLKPETTPKKIGSSKVEGVTNGWYTGADVQNWERRVDTVANSNWNQQSRRLRTALIRLVANGKFDAEQVSFETLWQGLPSPHAELMRTGLEKLQSISLLNITSVENEAHNNRAIMVSLNSSLLPEIQNLINRDITDFWLPIISDETQPVGQVESS